MCSAIVSKAGADVFNVNGCSVYVPPCAILSRVKNQTKLPVRLTYTVWWSITEERLVSDLSCSSSPVTSYHREPVNHRHGFYPRWTGLTASPGSWFSKQFGSADKDAWMLRTRHAISSRQCNKCEWTIDQELADTVGQAPFIHLVETATSSCKSYSVSQSWTSWAKLFSPCPIWNDACSCSPVMKIDVQNE